MAEFELWSKESLVAFARDATERLKQREEEVARLQAQLGWVEQDLDCAINAYRDLLRGWDSPKAMAESPSH
jgi:hypothetical protein